MPEAGLAAVITDGHDLLVSPVTGFESIAGFDPRVRPEFGTSPEVNQHTLWFQQTVFERVQSIMSNPDLTADGREESLRDLQRLFTESSVSALEFRGFVSAARQSIQLNERDLIRREARKGPVRRALTRLAFWGAES